MRAWPWDNYVICSTSCCIKKSLRLYPSNGVFSSSFNFLAKSICTRLGFSIQKSAHNNIEPICFIAQPKITRKQAQSRELRWLLVPIFYHPFWKSPERLVKSYLTIGLGHQFRAELWQCSLLWFVFSSCYYNLWSTLFYDTTANCHQHLLGHIFCAMTYLKK